MSVDTPTPFDSPSRLLERLTFPALRRAYLAGRESSLTDSRLAQVDISTDHGKMVEFAARMTRRIARLEQIGSSDIAPYRKLSEYRKLVGKMKYDYESLLSRIEWK